MLKLIKVFLLCKSSSILRNSCMFWSTSKGRFCKPIFVVLKLSFILFPSFVYFQYNLQTHQQSTNSWWIKVRKERKEQRRRRETNINKMHYKHPLCIWCIPLFFGFRHTLPGGICIINVWLQYGVWFSCLYSRYERCMRPG